MTRRVAFVVLLVVAAVMIALRQRAAAETGSVVLLPGVFGERANTGGHETITRYDGPQTCVGCHPTEAREAHASLHYQQSGPTPFVPNIPGDAGKNNGALNTYCGAISTSRYFTCAGCHATNGQRPSLEPSAAQLANVDCLMCHQANYARKAAGPYEDLPAVGQDGQPRLLRVPVEDASGFHFTPDESKMTISIVEAARTAGPTTRATCLRCHANAGGGDGTKRGDLSSVSASPPRQSDVHMSPAGEDMTCAGCHDAGSHRVTGRGLDLRENDVAEWLTCAKCHGQRPHGDYDPRNGDSRDAHVARVACQTCHIPTFAKDIDTELARDWRTPVWFAGAFGGQGGWKPGETRAANVVPTYRWFDGTSEVYVLGQSPALNADGEYEFGAPLGSVSSAGAKLYPMKEHRSVTARLNSTGQMIPHSTEVYFRTGDFTQAIAEGMARAGMSGAYTIVPVHTFQTINHGVEPADSALRCEACHVLGDDDGDDRAAPRMDLAGELGYALKGPQATVCAQCHEPEDPEGFGEMHDKHVADEGYDCSWCHTFSRPERGLDRP